MCVFLLLNGYVVPVHAEDIRGIEVSLQSYLSSVLHRDRRNGFFLPGKEPCCLLNRRPGVSQSLSQRVEEKHVLSGSGFELRTVHFVA
jgi:hypothetical protein